MAFQGCALIDILLPKPFGPRHEWPLFVRLRDLDFRLTEFVRSDLMRAARETQELAEIRIMDGQQR